MGFSERLSVIIDAKASDAIRDIEKLGAVSAATAAETQAAGASSGKFSGVLKTLGIDSANAGTAMKVGLLAGVAAIGAFVLQGAEKFVKLTAEVRAFQRVALTSAEDSSRLVFTFQRLGIEPDVAAKSVGMFLKKLDPAVLASYNIQLAKNKDGHIDVGKTLANVADQFSKVTDAEQRNKEGADLFGKSYQTMLPFLSKSKDEIKAIYDLAAKQHHVFSQEDLDKGKNMSLAMKDLHTAIEGVQLEAGSELVPAFAAFLGLLTDLIGFVDEFAGDIGGLPVILTAVAAAWVVLSTVIAETTVEMGIFAAAFAATPFGVVALGIGLAVAAFNLFSNSSKSLSQQVRDNAKAFNELTAVKAADKFEKDARALKTLGDLTGEATNKYKQFREIAESDPAAAQNIIAGMEARGQSTTKFGDILDSVTKKQVAQAHAEDDAKTMAKYLADGYDQLGASILATIDKQQKWNDLLYGSDDAASRYQHDLQTLKEKQDAYNLAIYLFGQDSPEAKAAQLDLGDAQRRAAQDADAATQANEQLRLKYQNNRPELDAQIQKYADLAAQGGPLAGFYYGQMLELSSLRDSLNSTPDGKTIHVGTEGVADAIAALHSLGDAAAGVGDVVVNAAASAFFGKRASGGPVEAGKAYLVGEEGPEPFIPSTNGYILPHSSLSSSHSGGGGGGGMVVVQNHYHIAGSVLAERELTELVRKNTARSKSYVTARGVGF